MNRVMIRLLSLSLLLTVALAAPAAAKAPIVGVGDQHAAMFSDPYFQKLGVKHSRFVLAWDWYRTPAIVAEHRRVDGRRPGRRRPPARGLQPQLAAPNGAPQAAVADACTARASASSASATRS